MLNVVDAQRFKTAIGFAMKAGKVCSGEFSVERAIKSCTAKLVAIDSTASEQSRKRWQDACKFAGIPCVEAEEVGMAIGKETHIVACIVESGFAQMALRACDNI